MNAARPSRHLADEHEDLSDEPPRGDRLRFEVIFASLWLAFGLFLLPALIFWVGDGLLGGYRENAGLATFYGDFFGDLADGSGRAWALALGPLLLIYVLRAIFIGVTSKPAARTEDDSRSPGSISGRISGAISGTSSGKVSGPRRAPPKKESVKRAPVRPARVEPRMGGD